MQWQELISGEDDSIAFTTPGLNTRECVADKDVLQCQYFQTEFLIVSATILY